MADLTRKQARFVAEYLIDLNATQAAIRAGYSKKTANEQGARLLAKVSIRAAVDAEQAARAERAGITRNRVLNETALLAFSDLTHYTVDDQGDVTLARGAPVGAMRALQSIKRRITTRGSGKTREVTREVEIRLWNKPDPLKLAGQHVDLFKDKVEHSGPDGQPIPVVVRFGGRYRPGCPADGA
jgi:phage terminase small subunit